MIIESFEDFVNCVREGYTTHIQNWTPARNRASGEKNFKVSTAYQDWNIGANVAEAQHCAAIINGLFSQNVSNIEEIWCAKKHNHDFIPGEVVKSTSYKSNLKEGGEWFPKDPDIAFTTIGNSLPNWFCQVKFDVQSHVKAVQALGDFFWGAVTKLVFEWPERRRALDYVFVWSEHSSDRHRSGGFLRFDDAEGQMELRLSPGFTRGDYGKCQFSKLDTRNPWWYSSLARLEPNNYTTIKQMLAAGTNGTFVRMFHQPGEMRVKSEYQQLFIPTGEGEEGWHVYVHRLLEASTYELRDSNRAEGSTVEKILAWIP